MTKHANQITSVSAVMGAPVADASGRTLGHVREFAVSPPVDANHVQGLVLRMAGAGRADRMSMAAITDLEMTAAGSLRMRGQAAPTPMPVEESYLLLERDLLDQQIIDVHGHKVVRVNDVELVWEQVVEATEQAHPGGFEAGYGLTLRIAEVEVGLRGAAPLMLEYIDQLTMSAITRAADLDLVPRLVVEPVPRQQAEQRRADSALGAREPGPQPHQASGGRRRPLQVKHRGGRRGRSGAGFGAGLCRVRGRLSGAAIRRGRWHRRWLARRPDGTSPRAQEQQVSAGGDSQGGDDNDKNYVFHQAHSLPDPAVRRSSRGPAWLVRSR